MSFEEFIFPTLVLFGHPLLLHKFLYVRAINIPIPLDLVAADVKIRGAFEHLADLLNHLIENGVNVVIHDVHDVHPGITEQPLVADF